MHFKPLFFNSQPYVTYTCSRWGKMCKCRFPALLKSHNNNIYMEKEGSGTEKDTTQEASWRAGKTMGFRIGLLGRHCVLGFALQRWVTFDKLFSFSELSILVCRLRMTMAATLRVARRIRTTKTINHLAVAQEFDSSRNSNSSISPSTTFLDRIRKDKNI